jgi:uncharacterized membrane protein (GlpM family)
MAGPLLGALIIAYRHRTAARRGTNAWRDWRVIASVPLSAALVLGAVAWYQVNAHQAMKHYRDATANNGLYGVAKSYPHELVDWLRHLRDAAFSPHFDLALLLLAALAVLAAAHRRLRPSVHDPRSVAVLGCALSVVLVIALFASQPNQEPRYLLPLLPLIAVLAAIVVASAGTRLLLLAAIALVAGESVMTNLASFGYLNTSSGTIRLAAPERDPSSLNALNAIVARTCTPSTANRINVVGADYPWLNFNTLQMLAAERFALSGRFCYYTSLGYAEVDPDAAWQRIRQFRPPYYISIDYGSRSNLLPAADRATIRSSDPFNRVNRAVYRRVVNDSSFRVLPETRQHGFVIFEAARRVGG